jgi:hypothetical protein
MTMRHRSIYAAAFLALAAAGQASACDGQALATRIASADEHRFWVDFWADLDPREARAEAGYYAADLKEAWSMAAEPNCASAPDLRWTKALLKRRLAALQASQLAAGALPGR